MHLHIFVSYDVAARPLNELLPMAPVFESAGSATRPDTIAKNIEEARASWPDRASEHPMTAVIPAVAMYAAYKLDGEQSVAQLFAGDNPVALMDEMSKWLGRAPNRVSWYGDNTHLVRKTIWLSAAQQGYLEHGDKIGGIYPVLLYGCDGFEMESLLEQRKKNEGVSLAAAIRLLLPPGDTFQVAFLNGTAGDEPFPRLKYEAMFVYRCFARAGAVPTVKSALPLLETIRSTKAKPAVAEPLVTAAANPTVAEELPSGEAPPRKVKVIRRKKRILRKKDPASV